MTQKFLDYDGVAYLWSKIVENTVTSVNNISPVDGNVSLTIPTVTDTYSATSGDAMSGKAVASAVGGITLSSLGAAAENHNHDGVYLKAHPTITAGSDTTPTSILSYSDTFTAITGVTKDTNGHVTSIATTTYTLPASINTDTKVTQAYSTTNNSYPVLMTATAGVTNTTSRGDTTSIVNNQIYANPSTGRLTAKTFMTGNGIEIL